MDSTWMKDREYDQKISQYSQQWDHSQKGHFNAFDDVGFQIVHIGNIAVDVQ